MSRDEGVEAGCQPRASHGWAPLRDAVRRDLVVRGPALTIREVRTVDNPYLPRTIEIAGPADEAEDEPALDHTRSAAERHSEAWEPREGVTRTGGTHGGVMRAGGRENGGREGIGRQTARHAWIALLLLAAFSLAAVPRLLAPTVPIGTGSILGAIVAAVLVAAALRTRSRSAGAP